MNPAAARAKKAQKKVAAPECIAPGTFCAAGTSFTPSSAGPAHPCRAAFHGGQAPQRCVARVRATPPPRSHRARPAVPGIRAARGHAAAASVPRGYRPAVWKVDRRSRHRGEGLPLASCQRATLGGNRAVSAARSGELHTTGVEFNSGAHRSAAHSFRARASHRCA
jgi:hypothetical protein